MLLLFYVNINHVHTLPHHLPNTLKCSNFAPGKRKYTYLDYSIICVRLCKWIAE